MDNSHTLVQSDVLGESDDEFKKKNVFLLLNVDGSLPFPGEVSQKHFVNDGLNNTVIWSEAQRGL